MDVLAEHADLAVGHRGLFFERLDIGVAESGQQGGRVFTPPGRHIARIENPTLTPFARGIYHMRNRTLLPGGGSPGLIGVESWRPAAPPAPPGTFELNPIALGSLSPIQGRFAQADPHATALPVMRELPFHGEAFGPAIDQFALEARFTDGANLYQYLGSRPYDQVDPTGLLMWGGWGDTLSKGVETMVLALVVTDTYKLVWSELSEWATDWSMADDHGESLFHMASMVSGRRLQEDVNDIADVWSPAVAGVAPMTRAALKRANPGTGIAARINDAFSDWLKERPRHRGKKFTVYIGERDNRAAYVGITDDIKRRSRDWRGTYDQLHPIATGLTYGQARCIEQVIISAHRTSNGASIAYDNRINSIAPTRLFARHARRYGHSLLRQLGIDPFNPVRIGGS